MTANEFKAWFEGFAEGIGDVPSPEQWARIRAKVKEIRDAPQFSRPLTGIPWMDRTTITSQNELKTPKVYCCEEPSVKEVLEALQREQAA